MITAPKPQYTLSHPRARKTNTMDSANSNELPFEFSEENVEKLKKKYSQEMKDDENNPIKVCMKLIYEAAIEKDRDRRLELSMELSRFVTESDGIINLFLALIDFDTSSQKVTTHNQRFIAVSQIVACSPKLCMPYEQYCDNITKQLKPLLVHEKPTYVNLASIMIDSMISSPHAKNKNISRVIFGDMISAIWRPNERFKPKEALLTLLNIFQNVRIPEVRGNLFPNLFYCYVALYNTPSHLKFKIKSCLMDTLSDLKPGAACCLLEKTLLFDNEKCDIYEKLEEEYEITIKLTEEESRGQHQSNQSLIVEVVMSLLESTGSELVLKFFFHFHDLIRRAPNERAYSLCAALIDPLLTQTVQESSGRLDILSIIVSRPEMAVDLVDRTLWNYLTLLRQSPKEAVQELNLLRNSLTSCLDILGVIATTILTQTDGDDSFKKKCLPVLRELRSFVRKDRKQLSEEDKTLVESLNSLIHRLEEITFKFDSEWNQGGDDSEPEPWLDKDKQSRVELDLIIKDLNDKLVPNRVHALIRLKQLVQANDKYMITQISTIYNMVEGSLADQDSYVFLACINLMAEMSVRKTQDILPKLVGLHSRQDLDIRQRINVGEALVRLIKQMNDTTPYYAQQIMPCLMTGCQDAEELMRMSSLTNMGEVCKNLGDSLGNYAMDVLSCVQAAVEDDSLLVRCAAIDLLRTTLSGLDRLKVESIQRELGAVYTLLKRVKSKSLDEKLSLQVDLALDEMDRIARDLLGLERLVGERQSALVPGSTGRGKVDLVKNIEFLSLLDNIQR